MSTCSVASVLVTIIIMHLLHGSDVPRYGYLFPCPQTATQYEILSY